jgi:hypothetical protein
MTIRYFDPLGRGFQRMKQALFQPFAARKWFVVGFTAFLAGLTDCHGGGNGGGGRHRMGRGDWDDLIYFPRHAYAWLVDNPGWFLLILFGLVVLIVLVILVTWLSSRGKFMFLDNVVHDRAQVAAPWYEFRTQGNSLFLWAITVGFLVFGVIVVYLVMSYSVLLGVYELSWEPSALIVPGILLLLGLIAIIVLARYLDLLLVDFVVPLMYRSKLRVLAGWRAFLPLFGSHLLYFIGYGFFYALLSFLIVVGVLAGVLLTCCLGLIVLIIPYINAVALLPISYTLRAFSVEFLEQFGPEYKIFPDTLTGREATT